MFGTLMIVSEVLIGTCVISDGMIAVLVMCEEIKHKQREKEDRSAYDTNLPSKLKWLINLGKISEVHKYFRNTIKLLTVTFLASFVGCLFDSETFLLIVATYSIWPFVRFLYCIKILRGIAMLAAGGEKKGGA